MTYFPSKLTTSFNPHVSTQNIENISPNMDAIIQSIARRIISDLQNITSFTKPGVNGQILKSSSDTILHNASLNNDIAIMTVVLNNQSGRLLINVKNKNGHEPLLLALSRGNRKSTELLIQAQANLDIRDKNGATPLHLACLLNWSDIVEVIIDRNVDLDAIWYDKNNGGNKTALIVAAEKNHEKCAISLVESGADINKATDSGLAPIHFACMNGSINLVELLIDHGADMPEFWQYDTGVKRPLIIAMEKGHMRCANLLINAGANVNLPNSSGYSPIQIALYNKWEETMILLIEKGVDINEKIDDIPLLLWGLNHNYNELSSLLVKKGARLDIKDNNGLTPLHYASRANQLDIVKMLIDKVDDINVGTNLRTTPLLLAVHSGHEECAKLLAMNHADIDKANMDGLTPLHIACCKGLIKTVEMLVGLDAELNYQNNEGMTPLKLAIINGSSDCAKFLINSGANVDRADRYGKTALHFACERGMLDVVKLLIDNVESLDVQDKIHLVTPLNSALINGHSECIKLLIESGANVNIEDRDGMTPLHAACERGMLDIIELLIHKAAYIDVQEKKYKLTPLHVAVLGGHIECVKLLINNKASINKTESNGWQPLALASIKGNKGMLEVLVANDAPIDAQGVKNNTALMAAMLNGHEECARFLILNGANVDLGTKLGETPLHVASLRGWFSIIELLIGKDAVIFSKDDCGDTPIHSAINYDHEECANFLIKNCLDLDIVNKYGETPLRLACKMGMTSTVKLLLSKKVDLNIRNSNGETALLTALKYDHNEIAELIINENANTNIPNNYLTYPLHLTCEKGLEKTTRLLLEKNANPNALDYTKSSPLHYSIQGKNEACTRLLLEKTTPTDESDSSGNSHFSLLLRYLAVPFHRELVMKILPIANLTKGDSLGNTPLHYAVHHKDKEIITFIISKLAAKDLITKNVYYETPWTQDKNSSIWIDGLIDKLEIALLNMDGKEALEVKNSRSKQDFNNDLKVLQLKYRPEADDFSYDLTYDYKINLEHLQLGIEKIPEYKENIDLNEFLNLYDTLISTPNASIIPDVYKDRKILEKLIEKIKNRTAYSGTPNSDDKEALEVFYKPIESALTHVIKALQNIDDDKTKIETLRALLLDGNMCGGKISSMAADLYYKVCLNKTGDFRSIIFNKLATIRENFFKSSLPRHPQNVHDNNQMMYELGVELGIPGGKEAQRFKDPYTGHGVDIDRARQGFFRRYTPYTIADALRKELKEDSDFRGKFIDFFVEHKLPIYEEWSEALDMLISNGKLSQDDNVKVLQEKIVHTIKLFDSEEEIDWNEISKMKDEVFINSQKLEVDLKTVFVVLKKCDVIL